MKFTVDKSIFQKAIHTVEGIISAREIRSVISNILIEAGREGITLTATDLELGIKTTVPAETEEPGTITLPAKKLSQSVREFRGSSISFQTDSEDRVSISDSSKVTKARISLMGSPSDEYPALTKMPDDAFVSFPTGVFTEMIRKTSYAVAEEDARYVFNGLYIQNEGAETTFVGTDGRRLARIIRTLETALPFDSTKSQQVILPNKGVRELSKLLDGNEAGSVAFDPSDRRVYFRIADVELICKVIDGEFPRYDQVIPKKQDHLIEINRRELENALRQVAVMAAEPSRQVKLTFAADSLLVSASTPDIGEAQDSIPIQYSGEEMTVAFNSNYLLDIIKVLDIEILSIGFTSPSAPADIRDPGDERFVSVIMPMKL